MAGLSIEGLKKELRRRVDGEVRFDRGTLAAYSTDASNYRLVPLGVVIPRHEGDVRAALAIARENAVAVLARGGGTSLGGQTCNSALVFDFSKYFNRIIKIDPDRRLAVVEPGVVQSQLNAALAPHGLFFAPDPTTKDRCNIGGMIGNNSCGAHSLRYGKTVDNLLEMDALLYDGTALHATENNETRLAEYTALPGREGEIYRRLVELRDRCAARVRERYPKIPRRVSGYNLDQLLPEHGFNLAGALAGSEGTLALTLRATLKLASLPRRQMVVVLGCQDIFAAADQVSWLLEYQPQALEGFDDRIVPLARARGISLDSLRLLPEGRAWLLVELAADQADEARDQTEALAARALKQPGVVQVRILAEPSEQRAVWSLRESGLGSSVAIEGMPRTYPGAEDTAVAPQKLGSYMRQLDRLLNSHGLKVAVYYGHFGDGCLHCRISFPFSESQGAERYRAAMLEIGDLVVSVGGSLSGEHGDGRARSQMLGKMFGPQLLADFADFKRIFDPTGAMNPGVVVTPDPLDANLRPGAWRRALALKTHLDYSREQGLEGVALGCVGIGKCRKLDAGTMCPSYMATREEVHSTRGRARLLFEALYDGLLDRGLEDPALYGALELCLSCKACKRECPAEVDMAAYKAEFLAHYHRSHRRSAHELFIGYLHELAAYAANAPQVLNFLSHTRPFSQLIKRALKFHPKRTLPAFARRPFRNWFASRPQPANSTRKVVLFVDTFTNFFDPKVGRAAVEVLERAGFTVEIPRQDLCCGRPLYDVGMLKRVRWRLAQILEALSPLAEQGVYVIGLEPSCLLTFRDELLRFFPKDPRAKLLSQKALLLDEFLLCEAPALSSLSLPAKALLHGHCHQKAIVGTGPTLTLLRQIEGLELTELDAGCCGMAGAFGYHRDRFQVSQQLGERVLAPAIRESPPETVIIADGFSCRTQIASLCNGRRALHLAQVLSIAGHKRGLSI
jgi:FAD/FMN-containing dehydrogenase/Fe-S oxidoreductase